MLAAVDEDGLASSSGQAHICLAGDGRRQQRCKADGLHARRRAAPIYLGGAGSGVHCHHRARSLVLGRTTVLPTLMEGVCIDAAAVAVALLGCSGVLHAAAGMLADGPKGVGCCCCGLPCSMGWAASAPDTPCRSTKIGSRRCRQQEEGWQERSTVSRDVQGCSHAAKCGACMTGSASKPCCLLPSRERKVVGSNATQHHSPYVP